MKMTELPYRRDTASVFDCVAGEPWSVFLDSGYPETDKGRYDIFAAQPYITLSTSQQKTTIQYSDGGTEISCEDPFQLVKNHLGDKVSNLSGLPFIGGALGYFAYDLGRVIETLPELSCNDLKIPDMAIGIYDWAVIVDHHLRRTWLVGQGKDPDTIKKWPELVSRFQKNISRHPLNFSIKSPISSNFDEKTYAEAFNRIKTYIREGDCYQVNLAQRFSVEVAGQSWDAYLNLRKLNPAPFSAYMNLPDGAVLSTSPERFMNVRNDMVETKPIKGTRRRSVFAYEDKALAVELLESEKDRAENLMIVDLLRNDLGKTCITGSVTVPELFALESYATVHHLVSTVKGRLEVDKHALDLLRNCFPGGSITGAPKLRSMEIIEELEPHRRNVYCGAIGYIGFDGNMDTNIAIRTLVYHDDKIYCWAGGGIVFDSKLRSEYQECFDKVAALLHLMEHKQVKNVGS